MAPSSGKSWQKIETYGLVTILAVLVWLYAESENIKAYPAGVDVQFVGSHELIIDPATPERVWVTFRSATRQHAQIQELGQSEPLKIELTSDEPNQVINLKQRLEENPNIRDMGISVVDTVPASITIRVRRITSVPLEVEPEVGDKWNVTSPKAEPSKVMVTIPQDLAERLRDVKLKAKVPDEILSKLVEGVAETIDNVQVELPEDLQDERVSVDPPTVKVTLMINQREREEEVTITILGMVALPQMGKFKAAASETTLDFILKGPPETIEKIVAKQSPVLGYVYLNPEELPQWAEAEEGQSLPVKLILPPDVSASPVSENVTVEIEKTHKPGTTAG